MIDIHPTSKVSPFADIEDSVSRTRIIIGAHTVVDSFVKIKPAGGAGNLVIGSFCEINSGCVLYTGKGLTIVRGEVKAYAVNVRAPVKVIGSRK